MRDFGECTKSDVKAICELLRAPDLALRSNKHKAYSMGCIMADIVAEERYLLLKLTDITHRDKAYLLNVPNSLSDVW